MEKNPDQPLSKNRRWPQFGLRSMLLVVAGVAIAVALLKYADSSSDEYRIQGTWRVESLMFGGNPATFAGNLHYTFLADGKLDTTSENDEFAGITPENRKQFKPQITYHLDPTKDPRHIDIVEKHDIGLVVRYGIYRLDGDTLTICEDHIGPRPDAFVTKEEQTRELWTMKRVRTN
jgi:uncharacterized protein (TIGR03067 family)